jgi:hypothetical protein
MKSNQHDNREGLRRRKVLECVTWAGIGVLGFIDSASTLTQEPRS